MLQVAKNIEADTDKWAHKPISSPELAVEFFLSTIRNHQQEQLRVCFLNKLGYLIDYFGTDGSEHSVICPKAEIMRRAIRLEAHSLLLGHNHPSGDPTPSQQDLTITRGVAQLAKMLDLKVVDHVIFSKDRYFSFRQSGLI